MSFSYSGGTPVGGSPLPQENKNAASTVGEPEQHAHPRILGEVGWGMDLRIISQQTCVYTLAFQGEVGWGKDLRRSLVNSLIRLPLPSPIYLMHVLSIPTWIIHISSVIEWVAAIWLIWLYAEASGNLAWRSLSFGMLPALVSAMCACTWHFFDNTLDLEWLVTLQAAMTVVGNSTMCWAAWQISKELRIEN